MVSLCTQIHSTNYDEEAQCYCASQRSASGQLNEIFQLKTGSVFPLTTVPLSYNVQLSVSFKKWLLTEKWWYFDPQRFIYAVGSLIVFVLKEPQIETVDHRFITYVS